jgi:2-iminobutanoate/2-iminopropanoate deaminase
MEQINVKTAPEALGPYSHAVRTGNLVFCSGQTPLNPETMKVDAVTIEDQTRQVLDNLAAVLAGVGLTLKNIVKTNVYLKSMDDFQGMNKVYEEMMDGNKPARATIEVSKNPLDALVEIECVAELKAELHVCKCSE